MSIRSTLLLALWLSVSAPAYATGWSTVFTSKTALEASQEVPVPGLPDPTAAEGGSNGLAVAIVEFDRRYRNARVKVTFSNLSGDFTRLHLHCNVRGSNGPIALGIVDLVDPGQDNSEGATLGSNTVVGTLSNRNFSGSDPCLDTVGRSITTVAQLARAIRAGDVYWNLHTAAFPAGELRGQVEPLERQRVRKNRGDD